MSPRTHPKSTQTLRPFLFFGLLTWALSIAGCQQKMNQGARLKPFEPSSFFNDGSSSRVPVRGTIPRGSLKLRRPNVTYELLQHGQQRYTIFCAPCHSPIGDGKGIIVRHGMTSPPSFHEHRLREAPDHDLFDVITQGKGSMYSYSDRIPVKDRWAIIAYIRALQMSQNTLIHEFSDAKRQRIESIIGRDNP